MLPALNEQEVIAQAICEADEALAGITADYEILVVDDGSTDSTREVAQCEALRRPAVRVIVHKQNRGYGAALRSGFQAATKDYVGFTDADCQFNLTELSRLVLLLSSCDIACGYRLDRQDGWLRNLYSKVYNFLVRLLLGTRVRDCDCALKLFRRETLEELSIHTNGFLVNAELLSKANLRGKKVIEVGVSHRPRPRGQSTVNVWHTIPVFAALIRFWWSSILFPSRVLRRSKSAETWSPSKTWAAAASLCLLSAGIFFGNLAYPFIEPDESRYAQIALEMLQSGDYIVPRLNGQPYLDKPPLLYWATAASFGIFGTNELAGSSAVGHRGHSDRPAHVPVGQATAGPSRGLPGCDHVVPLPGICPLGPLRDHGRLARSVHHHLFAGQLSRPARAAAAPGLVAVGRCRVRIGNPDERPHIARVNRATAGGLAVAEPLHGADRLASLAGLCRCGRCPDGPVVRGGGIHAAGVLGIFSLETSCAAIRDRVQSSGSVLVLRAGIVDRHVPLFVVGGTDPGLPGRADRNTPSCPDRGTGGRGAGSRLDPGVLLSLEL